MSQAGEDLLKATIEVDLGGAANDLETHVRELVQKALNANVTDMVHEVATRLILLAEAASIWAGDKKALASDGCNAFAVSKNRQAFAFSKNATKCAQELLGALASDAFAFAKNVTDCAQELLGISGKDAAKAAVSVQAALTACAWHKMRPPCISSMSRPLLLW